MTSPSPIACSTNWGDISRANILVNACWLKMMARQSIEKLYPQAPKVCQTFRVQPFQVGAYLLFQLFALLELRFQLLCQVRHLLFERFTVFFGFRRAHVAPRC